MEKENGSEMKLNVVSFDIPYPPDYGGVIDIYHQRMESSSEAMREHIEQIGLTLKEIYQRADSDEKATNIVANVIAEERFNHKA